jgi:peroxidase
VAKKPLPVVEFRSIDGSGNNLADPTMNATGTDFDRSTPAHFADGVSAPLDGFPNPRDISNVVVAGDSPDNHLGLSGFIYAWGQFIDHDLDLMKGGGPDFSVVGSDGVVVPVARAAIAPGTGPGTSVPAEHVNGITGWLDGSQVYGSDAATADHLRAHDGSGHLLTSEGNNLPIENGMFLAGDVRAQENPSLTALQTLFVREHNFQVDKLHAEHPDWDGDHLYQQARAIVGGEIEKITIDDFLPQVVGKHAIDKYHGYDPSVDATIKEEFAGAAYRWGHSTVSEETSHLSNSRVETDIKALKDVFFEDAKEFVGADLHGADQTLRHLSDDLAPEMDAHIVEDLRNFLADPPNAIDLAATNIQRQHDIGTGTLNETRAALSLTPYTDFSQITNDQQTVSALKTAFGTVDKIDLWTGGIAEKSANGALLGETFGKIVADQFQDLQDGDRLWYKNQLDKQTVKDIDKTTLSDIILRNTDTTKDFHLQKDAFVSFDGGVDHPAPGVSQSISSSIGLAANAGQSVSFSVNNGDFSATLNGEPATIDQLQQMGILHHFDLMA